MPEQGTYVIPVSNGILEHCERIGVALWVFLWMLDRTTKEAPGADGQTEGLVYGGRPIPARDIANDLRVSPRVVNLHLARLLEHGYIRKIGSGDGAPAGYCVLKSKKWTNRLYAAGTDNREENYPVGAKNSSGGEKNSSRTENKITETGKNSSPTYRNDTLQHKTTTQTKSKGAPFILPEWLPLDSWNSYLEMRHEKHKDPTEKAKALVVKKLGRLRASGQDPGEILDQSTRNAWTDVYELKATKGGANGNRNFNRAQEAVDSTLAGGRAALASFGFDRGPFDEIGLDDGRADGQGRGPVTIDGRRPRGLTSG